MSKPWNKDRLAYAPLGLYVAEKYLNGETYGSIAKEVGIPKGCVQNLCDAMGVKPRESSTTGRPDLWEQRLHEYVKRTGVEVIFRPQRLKKKSRIITRCIHGTVNRPCQVLQSLQFCCQIGSKLGANNPSYGVPSWNAGTVGISTGHGFGGKPSPEQSILPGVLYLIRYLDDSGTHFKIGVTGKSVSKRFKPGRLVSILHLHHATLGECFDLE